MFLLTSVPKLFPLLYEEDNSAPDDSKFSPNALFVHFVARARK